MSKEYKCYKCGNDKLIVECPCKRVEIIDKGQCFYVYAATTYFAANQYANIAFEKELATKIANWNETPISRRIYVEGKLYEISLDVEIDIGTTHSAKKLTE